MTKIKAFLAVLALLCTTLVGVALTSTPSTAKDTSWGARVQAKDTSWGGKIKPKDTSWGAKAPAKKDTSWGGKIKAWGTDVTHAGDDAGYAAAIKVRCNSGKIVYLDTGERTALSVNSADACTASGVDAIWVGSGQAVRCLNSLPPYSTHYYLAFGWHGVPSFASLKCYMQRPI